MASVRPATGVVKHHAALAPIHQALEAITSRLTKLEAFVAESVFAKPSPPAALFSDTDCIVDMQRFGNDIKASSLLQELYSTDNEEDESGTLASFNCATNPIPVQATTDLIVCAAHKGPSGFLYLGGPSGKNERRRTKTIPECLELDIPAFNPQVTNLNSEFMATVYDHIRTRLQTCNAAVFDFTGDVRCSEYTCAAELIYLIGKEGFANIFFVNIPTEFDIKTTITRDDPIPNTIGILGSFTTCERRIEYHAFIHLLQTFILSRHIDPTNRSFVDSDDRDGIIKALMFIHNERRKILNPDRGYWTNRGVHGIIKYWSTPDLVSLYKLVVQAGFKTDICYILRVALGVAIVANVPEKIRADELKTLDNWVFLQGELQTIINIGVFLAASSTNSVQSQRVVAHWQSVINLIEFINVTFNPSE